VKVRLLTISLMTFVLGGALGYLIAPRQTVHPSPQVSDSPRPKKAIADHGDEASQKALRARIRELEAKLSAMSLVPTNSVAAAVHQDRGWGGPLDGFRERMERMKKEDPARYSEVTNNMARWRKRSSEHQRARIEFLSSIDTSRMDVAAKGVHKSLQDQIAYREEIEQRLQDQSLDDDERHELMEKLLESNRQIRALNEVERNNLIEQTAQTLGFEGQDVKDISQTMREIIEATDNGFGGHHGRGGHGRGGRSRQGGAGR